MNQQQDLYELLQVSPNAELEIIQAAYRRSATRYSPNRDDSPEAADMVQRLNFAFEVLNDPERRAHYDLGRSTNIVSKARRDGQSLVRSFADSHLGQLLRPLVFGAVGNVFGVLLLFLSVIVATSFISLVWWLSDIFYANGLWPLGAIARLVAWLISIAVCIRLLILVGRVFAALARWAWRYSDYVVRPRVPMTVITVIVVAVLAVTVGIGFLVNSGAVSLPNRVIYTAPTPSNATEQTPTIPTPSVAAEQTSITLPTIRVPFWADPGDTISILGEGFPAYATLNDIKIGGISWSGNRTIKTEADGTLQVKDVPVPNLEPGIYKVEVMVEGADLVSSTIESLPPVLTPISTGWETYSNEKYRFSLRYPASWEVVDPFFDQNGTIGFLSPEANGYGLVMGVAEVTMLDEYCVDQSKLAELSYEDCASIDRRSVSIDPEYPAEELISKETIVFQGFRAIRVQKHGGLEPTFVCSDYQREIILIDTPQRPMELKLEHCSDDGPSSENALDHMLDTFTLLPTPEPDSTRLTCNTMSTGWSDTTPFFPGLSPTTEMARGILLQQYPNLGGLAPYEQQLLRNRAQAAAHIFELVSALGEVGELTCPSNTALLGGQPVRDNLEPLVIRSLQGSVATEPFQQLMGKAIIGLQGPPETAYRVRWALRITDDPGAMDAYRRFIDAFLLPRYQAFPPELRSIYLAGFNAEIENILGGRSSAEVDPASFIQDLLIKGLII